MMSKTVVLLDDIDNTFDEDPPPPLAPPPQSKMYIGQPERIRPESIETILNSDMIYNDPRPVPCERSVTRMIFEHFFTIYFLRACILITMPVLGFSMSPVIQRP